MMDLYNKMKNDGVVVYGAGKNGRRVISLLQKMEIKIKAVSDKNVKHCAGFSCVSLEKLRL